MPIFDFVCQDCGHTFEKLCLPGREQQLLCSACASDKVTKKISASGIQLEGSGWYRDGYGLQKSDKD